MRAAQIRDPSASARIVARTRRRGVASRAERPAHRAKPRTDAARAARVPVRMAAPRPGGRCATAHSSVVRARPGARPSIEDVDVELPQDASHRSGTVLTVSVVALAARVLVGRRRAGLRSGRGRPADSSTGLYPPVAVTEQGAQIRDLYTIVFLIAVVIFFLVEGLIVWSVIRYRRKPGDDVLPAQTHGNNVAELDLDDRPDDHRRLPVRRLVADAQRGRHRGGRARRREIRAVAGQFQWQFDYLVR